MTHADPAAPAPTTAPDGADPRQPRLLHRPGGIGHPYATSLDQRVPLLPLTGRSCRLGVVADPAVCRVRLQWRAEHTGETVELDCAPASADAADSAALSGGEGHLAQAQAASLGGEGGWAVQSPPVQDPRGYAYRFVGEIADGTEAADGAESTDGTEVETAWFRVAPAGWGPLPQTHTVRQAGDLDRVLPGSLEFLTTVDGTHRARFALPLAPGDHVVGFGERYDRLDQCGHRLDCVVFEQYKSQGVHGRTYLPMPFAHVVRADGTGWGFHVRTSRRSWYDVGAGNPDRLVVEVDLGGSRDEVLDLGVFDGDPAQVLAAFLDEAGRAQQLPDWVFRLWASGNEWNTQQIVTARMDTHRDLDIPVGVVVIEAWSDEEGIMIPRDATYPPHEDGRPYRGSDFSYPQGGAWPDPVGMVADLHERGIKVVLWQIPLLKTAATEPGLHDQVLAEGRALVAGDHAVREADGTPYLNRGWWFPRSLMPDLSTERTRQWWTAKRDYLVRDWDIDGFKTDGGEHAWGADLRYGDGRRGDEGNNRYPVHYARAFGDLLRRHGKAPITFSRSGFTGSQAHGIFWAGDEDSTWVAFRSSITAGLTAAACGIVYWGWDLAGFSGPVPDAELYLRATAASTFMPIMQYHSEFHHHQPPLRDRTPWHVAQSTGDERVIPVFRAFAELRERVVPYLAQQATLAVAGDRPLMRPLFFDHPDDPQVWQHPLQWQLGDDLLVAPVTEPGVETATAYLPAGRWVDLWTGEPLDGGRTVQRPTPIETIPVYARAGSDVLDLARAAAG